LRKPILFGVLPDNRVMYNVILPDIQAIRAGEKIGVQGGFKQNGAN
jgi:hypothetical protein